MFSVFLAQRGQWPPEEKGEKELRTLIAMFIGLTAVTLFGCGSTFNDPPRIENIATNKTEIRPGDEVAINVIAKDPDGDALTYEYQVSSGEIVGSGSIVTWIAPQTEGTQFLKVTVSDGDKWDQESITLDVIAEEGAPCPFGLAVETELTTTAGVYGLGTLTQSGNPIEGADGVCSPASHTGNWSDAAVSADYV